MTVIAFGLLAAAPLAGRTPFSAPSDLDPAQLNSPDDNDVDLSPVELAALARSATVRVAGRTCGATLIGSGFVARGLLLTNRHLVVDALEAKVDQPTAPAFAKVARVAAGVDLAALSPVDAVPLELASTDPDLGEAVVFAGHQAGGSTTSVEQATVHLYGDGSVYGVEGPVLFLDGASASGFSGGPVLNRRGQVVGILQGYEPTLRLTLAVPVSAVTTWLASGPDLQPEGPARCS